MSLDLTYCLLGLLFLATAWRSAVPAAGAGAGAAAGPVSGHFSIRRLAAALFWLLLAVLYLFGSRMDDFGAGVTVIGLALLATMMMRHGAASEAEDQKAEPHDTRLADHTVPEAAAAAVPEAAARGAGMQDVGGRIFLPLLCIPFGVVLFSLLGPFVSRGSWHLLAPHHAGQSAYMLAALLGLGLCWLMFRPTLREPLDGGTRILHDVGWAAITPQLLAVVGGIYAAAGVDHALTALLGHWGAPGPLAATLLYAGGMIGLTVLIGNAFAAFPIMFGACALPFLIRGLGAPAAPIAAIGMLCGYCGTLLTPMAVYFNVVPVTLLRLRNTMAVIRVQAPTAGLLFFGNTLLLYLIVRFQGLFS